MASCEIKQELNLLKKEEAELLLQAKNEVVISKILLDPAPISKANMSMLVSVLGTFGADIAKKIHDANAEGDVDKTIKNVKLFNDSIKHKPAIRLALRNMTLSAPEAKYELLDMSLEDAAKEGGGLGNYFLKKFLKLNGEEKYLAKKNKMLIQVSEMEKDLAELDVNSKEYASLERRIDALNDKISGESIAKSLLAIPLLYSKNEDMFPRIQAVSQTDESKATAIKDGDSFKGEIKSGYESKNVRGLAIVDNTLVSEHEAPDGKKQYSSEHDDEVSALAMLLGIDPGMDIVVPDFVKNSIKINSLEHMEDVYKLLQYEVGSKEFNDIWAIDQTSPTYEEDLEKISGYYSAGVIPRATILTSLGKSIYRSLPVQFSKALDSELEQKAIAQLGLYAIRYMSKANLITVNTDPFTYNNDNKSHILIGANIGYDAKENLVASADVMGLVSELQHLGVSSDRHAPREIGEKHQVSQTIRNSFIETSENVKENLQSFESKQFRFNDHMSLMYDMYMNPNGGKEAAYAFAGVLAPNSKKSSADQMKELSKINYAKMQIDAMMKVYEDFGMEGKAFTLPYDYTVSGRYMINSLFNPQESKISRFLVTSKDLDSTIHVVDGKLDSGDLDVFRVGIAQSFDLDPDKTTDKSAIEKLSDIVEITDRGVVRFKDTIKDKPNPFKIIYDALSAGKLQKDISPELMEQMMDVTQSGSGFHAMQAIMALKQLHDYASSKDLSGDIKLSFSLESDAITSGMILTLLEIGTPAALELASKGGVYTDSVIAKWENMHSLYVNAGGTMQALSQDGKFKLTHGWLRDFSKDASKMLGSKDFVFKLSSAMSQEKAPAELKARFDMYIADGKEAVEFFKDEVAFDDFYETVARKANRKMLEIKEEISNELIPSLSVALQDAIEKKDSKLEKAVVAQIKEASAAHNIVDLVGSITRSLAKPPVMVYIYGAMMDSIKKKIIEPILMPKIYDITLSSKVSTMPYSEFLEAISSPLHRATLMAQVVLQMDPDKKFTDEQRADAIKKVSAGLGLLSVMLENAPALQFKKFNGTAFVNDDQKLMKNVVFPEKVMNRLSKAVDMTLGASFEHGFADFGLINSFRDSVKSAEVVRYTMFKYKLKQGLDKVVKSAGSEKYKVSSKDIATVIDGLEKAGFGHSVRDINGGRQPLYKKDALEKEIRTILNVIEKTAGEKWGKNVITSAAIEGKEFAPNTGASGVITVHNIDGYIDSVSARAFDLIRIYDGSVSGINRLDESVEEYNKTTLGTSSWSSYSSQITDLHKQIKILERNGELDEMISAMSDSDKETLLNTIEKLMGYGEISEEFDVETIIQDKINETVLRTTSKKNVRDGGKLMLSVMHSYLTDTARLHRAPIGDWNGIDIKKGAIESVYNVYKKILLSLQEYRSTFDDGAELSFQNESESNVSVVKIADDSRYRKGTPSGDAKDVAMRSVASTSIVELANDLPSSSKTTQDALPWNYSNAANGIVMLARNGALSGKPLTESTKNKIDQAFGIGATFVVGDMKNVDSQFIDYLDAIGASYKVYTTNSSPRISVVETITGVNISTKSSDDLGKALTNVHYSKDGKSDYDITPSMTGLVDPKDSPAKEWFGKKFLRTPYQVFGHSVEAWYKSNNSEAKGIEPGAKADAYDMALMQSLIEDKLTQHPELVKQIESRGGSEFLKKSTHNVSTSGSRWETNNGKNMFINALSSAFDKASTHPSKVLKSTPSGKLKWLSVDKNIIVSDNNSAQVKINSIDELADLSEQFQDLMVERHGLDKNKFSQHKQWFKDLLLGMANEGIEFKPIVIKFQEKVFLDGGEEVYASMGFDDGVMRLSTDKKYNAYPLKVVAHEYSHAITAIGLQSNPNLLKKVQDIMAKAKEAGLGNDPKTGYAFKNETEFLAEVMSNPTLQNELSKIESIGNRGIDVLKKIFDYMLKHLKATDKNSLLHDALEVVLDVNKDPEAVSDEKPTVASAPTNVSTNKYELFENVFANGDQEKAIDSIVEFLDGADGKPVSERMFILKGRGGTGKTTIIAKAIEQFMKRSKYKSIEIGYSAPTHKAKKVLAISNKKAGLGHYPVVTVQSGVGMKTAKDAHGNTIFVLKSPTELKFESIEEQQSKFSNFDIIVVDEASMLDDKLLGAIQNVMNQNSNIFVIFMGDNVQLPPVEGNVDKQGNKLDSNVFNVSQKAELTVRMRQAAESPILPVTDLYANAVEAINLGAQFDKDNLGVISPDRTTDYDSSKNEGVIYKNGISSIAEDFVADFKKDESTRVVSYTSDGNANVRNIPDSPLMMNEAIRSLIHGSEAALENEYLAGDLIMGTNEAEAIDSTKHNPLSISNGGEYRIKSVRNVKISIKDKTKKYVFSFDDSYEMSLEDSLDDAYVGTYNVLSKDGVAEAKKYIASLWTRAKSLNDNKELQKEIRNAATEIESQLVNVVYGYALNSHKAQGSTYRNVYVMEDNIMHSNSAARTAKERLQSMYVAVSRASKKLVIVSKNNKRVRELKDGFVETKGKNIPDVTVDISTKNGAITMDQMSFDDAQYELGTNDYIEEAGESFTAEELAIVNSDVLTQAQKDIMLEDIRNCKL